jgi:hypothetical protein
MKIPFKKCIRDGKVAVIYSPNHEAGWSTWNKTYKYFLMHDASLVDLIESNQEHLIEDYLNSIFPDNNIYVSPNNLSLAIAWVPVGTQFYIKEYDGSESIVFNHDSYWEVA